MLTPLLVFTDLDGTLLNHDDYSYADALPALNELRARDIPLILVSSKTLPEILALRKELDNHCPLVCENGSLVAIPEDLLAPLGVSADPSAIVDGYYHDYRGASRETILSVLEPLHADYNFIGFAQMTHAEVAACTGLSLNAAALASARHASEPILWRDSDEKREEFADQLARHDLRLLKGGRFYHVMGQCDKGDAVRYLQKLYQHQYRATPFSIALGDSPNDLDMLKQVDAPVIMPTKGGVYMVDNALKKATLAPYEGAKGWGAAVLALLASELLER